MFTMTLTRFPFRDRTAEAKIASGDGTGPASYATGGEAVTLADIGLSEVWWWAPIIATNGTVILVAIYDATNAKLKWFDMAGAEVANATNLSAYTYTFFVTGK